MLAKLIPGAHGAVPQCVPGPACVPSEFCFRFWLGSVVEAQSGCGVLSMSVFHSLWVAGCCTSVKHRVSFTPFQTGCSSQHTEVEAAYACRRQSLKSLLHCTRGACSFSQLLMVLFSSGAVLALSQSYLSSVAEALDQDIENLH